MKLISLLTTAAFLAIQPGVNAQVPTGARTIQAYVDLGPFAQATGANRGGTLVFPWNGGGTTQNAIWTITDAGNGKYTIFNSAAGYATWDISSLHDSAIQIFTNSTPYLWDIKPGELVGLPSGMWTISAPLDDANSDTLLWTVHDSTSTLFADLASYRFDSPANRLWIIA
ncbi:hypothetical protein NP233_g7763 [Leucocoprinus birnbaumii]|uniref:Ricin B lectin domain-containing protein n=1 Tax=Leucocoprinus birnbaumii TaxID=56174 RepID=A0AAD5VP83_9AGAR|nr:hypothetical protein NP233_g7763 [Leucocoprinus birnbaumii]